MLIKYPLYHSRYDKPPLAAGAAMQRITLQISQVTDKRTNEQTDRRTSPSRPAFASGRLITSGNREAQPGFVVQRITGFTTMRYINVHFTYLLILLAHENLGNFS